MFGPGESILFRWTGGSVNTMGGAAVLAVSNSCEEESVAIDDLTAGDSPRLAGCDAGHVRALAEFDGPLPPITVDRRTNRVVDGMHRVAAARLRGRREIEVVFVTDDEEDLFVRAVRANAEHGLPLTLADRRAAAARILAAHPCWSDRAVAGVTGLAPSTVGAIRDRSTDRSERSNARRGRDGVRRPLSAADGRVLAGRLLAERPDAPVREIAAIAGIAPSTVHDVRQRLRAGRDVVPDRRRSQPAGLRLVAAREPMSVAELGVDPALRHTEDGRALLRLLGSLSLLDRRFDEVAAVVPCHLADQVAELARQAATAWSRLADRLASRPPNGEG